MRRYATIWIKPLNSGTGSCVRNFEQRQDFEQFWRQWVRFPCEMPLPGAYGSIGDGVIGLTYKIYGGLMPAGEVRRQRRVSRIGEIISYRCR